MLHLRYLTGFWKRLCKWFQTKYLTNLQLNTDNWIRLIRLQVLTTHCNFICSASLVCFLVNSSRRMLVFKSIRSLSEYIFAESTKCCRSWNWNEKNEADKVYWNETAWRSSIIRSTWRKKNLDQLKVFHRKYKMIDLMI